MPATVYTRRLGFADSAAAGDFLMFVADEQATYVLRDIIVTNRGTEPGLVQVYSDIPGGGQAFFLLEPQLAGQTSIHVDVRQELWSGEALHVYSQVQPFNCVVTGYRFTST